MVKAKEPAVCIMGGGSWATAIAKIVMAKGQRIHWYMRRPEQIEEFQSTGYNPKYLRTVHFDVRKIKFYSNINLAVRHSDILVFATPSPFLKSHLASLKVPLLDKIVVSAIKGIVPDENMIVTDYLQQFYGVQEQNIAVIAGPCHAEEVAMEHLSYLTVASKNPELARYFAGRIANPYLRTSLSTDVRGIEYASVLKNVYAIMAGICHGLRYGDNFQAILVSNCIREMNRFVEAVAADDTRDVQDAAYLGDLLVTAYSKFSRNRNFGSMIGKGYSISSIQDEMQMIAEGYYGTKCIHEINKEYQVNTPILDACYSMLYDRIAPVIGVRELTKDLS